MGVRQVTKTSKN